MMVPSRRKYQKSLRPYENIHIKKMHDSILLKSDGKFSTESESSLRYYYEPEELRQTATTTNQGQGHRHDIESS